MNRAVLYSLFSLFLSVIQLNVNAQLSKGGTPIQVEKLKSASFISDLVVMPTVDNEKMKIQSLNMDRGKLKPFTFAHSFDVSLNLQNSGFWYNTSKVNVWQLRIRSVGAYSLNLIFDQYRLPENAKLFIINEKSGEVKGAYTSENNSESKVFAVEPMAGEELLLQYEEPVNVPFKGELEVAKVSHDFVGIAVNDHRPKGISGACNINVNCDLANSENIRDGVCRIIINGTDLCTGTLVNNTLLDGTPYVLTAYHCLVDATKQKTQEQLAQASVFLFNYESPYCGSIDGDVSHSLSGSTLKASFDSLDFSLVQINNHTIPDQFRPYLVGWNRKNIAPSSSICIHHPLGDIKKIAIDNNTAATAKFTGSYLNNSFWNILTWEHGVTEEGSSGGPLFDQNKLLIGSLTGGAASCPPGLPNNDYFEKFALAWDHRKESNKQLKAWLDPTNSGVEKLDGMVLNSEKTSCSSKTNFRDNDTHALIKIPNGITKKGYWGGSNTVGFTEFAEQFKFSKSCEVSGISIGIAKIKITSSTPYINIKVYGGNDVPNGNPLYSEKFYIKNFYADAMNYLPFATPVKTTGNFFVSYDISSLSSSDSLMVYIANRTNDVTNSFLLKNEQGWSTYNSQNLYGNGSALLMEINACTIVDTTSVIDSIPVTKTRFYPNPLYGSRLLTIETEDEIDSIEDVEVFDLMGKVQNISITQTAKNQINISFYGKRAGIYFVQLKAGGKNVKGKIAYMP